MSGGRMTELLNPGQSAELAQTWANENKLPFFEPAYTVDEGRGPVWRFRCRDLLENGRCGRYETRPDLCRRYEPLQDGLCVHYGGAEAGDPTVSIEDPVDGA